MNGAPHGASRDIPVSLLKLELKKMQVSIQLYGKEM